MSDTNFAKIFFRYALPGISGMVAISLYILADTYFISSGLGSIGVTALNLAIPVFSLVHGSGLMLGMGGGAKYSVLSGNGKSGGASACLFSSLTAAVPFCTVFLFSGLFFSYDIALFLGADRFALDYTAVYVKVILLFSPAFILNDIFQSFVRNDGNPELAMSAMITASFSNIILDYIFIFPLGLGMFGAVLATGLSPVIGIAVLSLHIFSRKRNPVFKPSGPDLKIFADIFSVGAPSFFTEMSSGIVIAVFNSVIFRISGNTGIAAYGIIANISLVVVAVFTGLSQGMQPLLSREFGRDNFSGCMKILKLASLSALFIAVIFYTAIFSFASPITALFNKENNVLLSDMALTGLRIYFAGVFFAGFNIVVSVFFSTCGKTLAAQLISLARGFFVIIPASVILSTLFGMVGVWLSFPVTEALVTLVFCFSAFLFRLFSSKHKLKK